MTPRPTSLDELLSVLGIGPEEIVTAAVRDGRDTAADADVQRRQGKAQEWLREQIGEAT